MNFEINTENIPASFDEIAKELLTKTNLVVGSDIYEITEIEFSYFTKKHEDKYALPHKRKRGEWRVHSNGIEITLSGLKREDGGILIRGVKHEDKYINGSKNVLQQLFQSFGLVNESASIVLEAADLRDKKIIKTARQLSGKVRSKDFHDAPYRYLVDLDQLDMEEAVKAKITENHTEL